MTPVTQQNKHSNLSGAHNFYTAHKMKLSKRFFLLSAIILCGIFFWIFRLSRILDSMNRESILHSQNEVSVALHHMEEKKMHSKIIRENLITLPKDLTALDLKHWEIFPEEGEENFVNNEVDYLKGERATPALTFKNRNFFLNNMNFRIFSGAIHYFRVVPEYWLDRLKKLKACGLNTVETYVPWNLHEPNPGKFDFDGMLNLRKFITMAAELGLYVILRPGPYICSEFDFGGLPGWLLGDPTMKVRTNHRTYIDRVNKYFSVLLPQVLDLQFAEGGPIIMFQVENEYLSYGIDSNHVKLLLYMLRNYGVQEAIVTSDHEFDLARTDRKFDVSKYALHTINGDELNPQHIEFVKSQNLHFPIMVMELWCGWFDLWKKKFHQTQDISTLDSFLSFLMDQGSSFNLYMFIGGTNFGFTSGAINISRYELITTSYDYNAPLTEAGDTTPKYFYIRQELLKFYKTLGIPYLPEVPPNLPKGNYGALKVMEIMEWSTLLSIIPMLFQEKKLDYMENFADRSGRHYTFGYIVYSHLLRPKMKWNRRPGPHLTGYVSGRLTAMVNGETFFVGTDFGPISEDEFAWDRKMESLTEGVKRHNKTNSLQLDLMVENQGRVHFVRKGSHVFNIQRKGMKGSVMREVFGITQEEWSIKFLHFDKQQCEMISKSHVWTTMKSYRRMLEDTEQKPKSAPTLYRIHLNIEAAPKDTFVNLNGWTKGVVIVNNFNLGRYWNVGPQRTLYLPAPLLKQGTNEIMVFEEYSPGKIIELQDKPNLG